MFLCFPLVLHKTCDKLRLLSNTLPCPLLRADFASRILQHHPSKPHRLFVLHYSFINISYGTLYLHINTVAYSCSSCRVRTCCLVLRRSIRLTQSHQYDKHTPAADSTPHVSKTTRKAATITKANQLTEPPTLLDVTDDKCGSNGYKESVHQIT